jgi:Cu-Zn family superoxide dismutase
MNSNYKIGRCKIKIKIKIKSFIKMIPTLLIFAFFAGCSKAGDTEMNQSGIKQAIVVIHPTAGHYVHGVVKFTKKMNGIEVIANVEGLEPGLHGFHIHEWGDCSADDATSAGGHFNPDGRPHAGPNDENRHVGDLGNLEADENGIAHYQRVDNLLAFSGKHSIIGRSVIIHAGADDLTSQPSGSAGARVACGVIGIAGK